MLHHKKCLSSALIVNGKPCLFPITARISVPAFSFVSSHCEYACTWLFCAQAQIFRPWNILNLKNRRLHHNRQRRLYENITRCILEIRTQWFAVRSVCKFSENAYLYSLHGSPDIYRRGPRILRIRNAVFFKDYHRKCSERRNPQTEDHEGRRMLKKYRVCATWV